MQRTVNFPFDGVMNLLSPEVKLITICNPNNPTGGLVPVDQIQAILEAAPMAIVYVDEAYYEFLSVVVPLLDEYPNLVVTRTFSKAFGLSALRVGYALAE